MVRDHVLASSGLLNPEIGGPSVKPYQPEGLWEAATSGRGLLQSYVQDQGADLYRRGMYTFIKRTMPPPAMLIFDASNRDQCEVRRLSTNTPLQALIMLNDPTVLEASRVLAQRLAAEASPVEEKIDQAFRLILARKARPHENALLGAYFEDALKEFTQQPEAAERFLQVGEYPQSDTTDAVTVAALMQVVHTLYNMDEALTKN